jgi:hydroxyacid-oxoacid transhydrogenase
VGEVSPAAAQALTANDTAFQLSAANVRFGPGVTREVGMDLRELGARRALVLMDPGLRDLPAGQTVVATLREADVPFEVFDGIAIEPTDRSFGEAIAAASDGRFDALVAVGGGSTIDTAKAANLYSTYPAEFLDYVNAPVGEGRPVPGPLKPLIAVPTTAGTGSETTGVAIFDYLEQRAKTGIAHRHLKPTLGLVDPENTRSLPPAVAASAGLDVLSHALESYTAAPYTSRPRPARPLERPAYQGSNPISDVWALRALELVNEYLLRAVREPADDEARGQMLLAAAMAGIGFGNAGVHLPHGMSYPVAGMVCDYRHPGYAVDHPLIPHGISVILHTPAVLRFTAPAAPERHRRAAMALGTDIAGGAPEEIGPMLAGRVVEFMRALGVPNGLAAVGYTEADIPALVEGTLPQHRVTNLSPVLAGREELASLFRASLRIW